MADPLSSLPQQMGTAFAHAIWTLLCGPAGWLFVGLIALRLLVAFICHVKRSFGRFARLG